MNIYLDNAATSSPKPRPVLEEVQRALTRYNANPGRSAHPAALEAAHCVFETRAALAGFLHAREEDCVAFAFNCTDALNLALKGVLRRGDHVVSTLLEHNSVLRPLSELSSRGQIALTLVSPRPDGMVNPADVRREAMSKITHALQVQIGAVAIQHA